MRKAWAPLLVYYLLAFVGGIYPYLTLLTNLQPLAAAQIAVDAVAIWGLFGFVFRRTARSVVLRLLFRLVSLVVVGRAFVVGYVVAPNLFPWESTKEQLVTALLLATIPLALLVAVALWRHGAGEESDAPSR